MRLATLIHNWGLQYLPWLLSAFATTKQDAGVRAREQEILVISASVGAGHVRAAEALCASAALAPSTLPVRHLDAMDYVPRPFRKFYSDLYIFLVHNYPDIWGYVYRKTNHTLRSGMFDRIRRKVERLATRRLAREILKRRPQAIICTHFLPAEVLSSLRREKTISCPVWVQVTDFDLHGLWVHSHISGYFVANREIGSLLQSHGVPESNIHVTGIPVMPAFAQTLDREQCAAALGLDSGKKTVLLSGGGEGVGRLEELAARLLLVQSDLQVVALAGKNPQMLKKLQALSQVYPGRLVALGYTRQVERVMACCDVAVIKPGGLTTSECLVMGLPMVLSSAVPGQEEHNADFLLEQGVACKATHPVLLEHRVRELISSASKLEAMRAKAKALGKAQAAFDVMNHVLN